MGLFDSIGDWFKGIPKTLEHAAEAAYDFSKDVGTRLAVSIADGSLLFVSGWRDVFSGDFKNGLSKVAFGMAEVVGIVSPSQVKKYEDVLGETSLWSLQESTRRKKQMCFSEYRQKVIENIKREGLTWNDSMEKSMRDGLPSMTWICPTC